MTRPPPPRKSAFTWAIRSTEVPPVRLDPAQTVLDGTDGCCDCYGCAIKLRRRKGTQQARAAR
jgi:hypothetical protein